MKGLSCARWLRVARVVGAAKGGLLRRAGRASCRACIVLGVHRYARAWFRLEQLGDVNAQLFVC